MSRLAQMRGNWQNSTRNGRGRVGSLGARRSYAPPASDACGFPVFFRPVWTVSFGPCDEDKPVRRPAPSVVVAVDPNRRHDHKPIARGVGPARDESSLVQSDGLLKDWHCRPARARGTVAIDHRHQLRPFAIPGFSHAIASLFSPRDHPVRQDRLTVEFTKPVQIRQTALPGFL